MKKIININYSLSIEVNKKFKKTIITLNKNGQKEVLSNLKTNDYFWSDIKFDENYIIVYSRGCMVNQIPLKIESAYNIKTDTILDIENDVKLATELEYMFISKYGFNIGTILSVINSLDLKVTDNDDVEHMIRFLTNGNNKITKKEVIKYIAKAYPLLSRFSQIETPITVMDYKMILKEFDSSYLYFHKMPQIIDSSISKLKKADEPMHSSISVLAVSCDRPFVVEPKKVEEFKNTKTNPEVIEQTEEMAEEFRVNNLVPVLKKTRKPNK